MKAKYTLYILAFSTALLLSCKEKPQTTAIIATKQVKKAPAKPAKMQDINQEHKVEWLGNEYKVEIRRHTDTELPMVKDDAGSKYYDNMISLRVLRSDGTVFFSRDFRKTDFSGCYDAEYGERSALLGIVLEKAEGDYMYFAASVGSPDVLSDDYVPMIMTLSRMGDVSIKKDIRLDSDVERTEEEGV